MQRETHHTMGVRPGEPPSEELDVRAEWLDVATSEPIHRHCVLSGYRVCRRVAEIPDRLLITAIEIYDRKQVIIAVNLRGFPLGFSELGCRESHRRLDLDSKSLAIARCLNV